MLEIAYYKTSNSKKCIIRINPCKFTLTNIAPLLAAVFIFLCMNCQCGLTLYYNNMVSFQITNR